MSPWPMLSPNQQPIGSVDPQSGHHQDGPSCDLKVYNAASTSPRGRAARHRSKKYVSGNKLCYVTGVAEWGFLTNHARVLLCVAHDPGARLRDIAASLGITERSAHGILTDLSKAGYVLKQRDGRRNRYQIQAHLPLREPASREVAIGEVLALLLEARTTPPGLRA
jgi:IclR helix-turn-helix domain